MSELVYTANDEEPKCGRCDNICESDELCIKRCGPEHCLEFLEIDRGKQE